MFPKAGYDHAKSEAFRSKLVSKNYNFKDLSDGARISQALHLLASESGLPMIFSTPIMNKGQVNLSGYETCEGVTSS